MPSESPESSERLDHFRELLQARQRALQDVLKTRTQGGSGALSIAQPPDSPDDAAVVGELNDDTFAQIQVADRELAAVQAALARIDDGSYGSCIDCDEPIAPARLEVEPWAERCIECQTQHEQREPGMAQVPQHRSM